MLREGINKMSLYPLLFAPRFVEKMWGGRKLQDVLGKTLTSNKPVGESWELYDFPPGVVDGTTHWVSSVVANGPLKGQSLHTLVTQHKHELLGAVKPTGPYGQFPLLIKFLDAREDLSVQVHPDESYAAAHPEAHLKSEAWYVMQHDANARLLKGLSPGVTKESFTRAITTGDVEKQIRAIPVKVGDCHYLPSGTIHALGAGILVAEVQTPSDTTFRVYDFNRVDPSTGKLRKLHVEEALACIDFSGQPVVDNPKKSANRLVDCPYFVMEKARVGRGVTQPIAPNKPAIWIVLEGQAQLKADGFEPTSVKLGDTVLLPAAMKNPMLTALTDSAWLEVTFPQ
jgi:mannose-6-phosphate isomerase